MDEKGRETFEKDLNLEEIQIYRSICMIVGCAGAGKTTLFRKLCKADYTSTESTVGLEVYSDVFVVDDDTCRLSVADKKTSGWDDGQKLMTLFDFAGQCAYYACHQVYLSRRAVFVLVIDMSKALEEVVNEIVCDQKDTIFRDWRYIDYFVFWLKSIHTYCNVDSPVILVATHLDQTSEERIRSFYHDLLRKLPQDLNLNLHLDENRYISTGLYSSNIRDLEKCICRVVKSQKSWGEKMPQKWVQLEKIIREKKERKIVPLNDFKSNFEKNEDNIKIMLRFFRDIGMILYFDEPGLSSIVIVDVQWFVDAFKYVISDMNHVRNKVACGREWKNFYKTGQLKDYHLVLVWKSGKFDIAFHQKKQVLLYMQRLGLIVVGDDLHYVPCVNKKNLGDSEKSVISNAKETSSVLVYQFDFLPHFFFYRVVVACFKEEGWKLLKDEDESLFNCAAFFTFEHHNIVIGVTNTSIQLQIFIQIGNLDKEITFQIRETLNRVINNVTCTFHRKVLYKIGYTCSPIHICDDVDEFFIEEEDLLGFDSIQCPRHGLTKYHAIKCRDLLHYWKEVRCSEDEDAIRCCVLLRRQTAYQVDETVQHRPNIDNSKVTDLDGITNAELADVSRHIGIAVEILGAYLGIPQAQIQRIQMDNPKALAQIYMTLLAWKERKDNIATAQTLMEVLDRIDDIDKDAIRKELKLPEHTNEETALREQLSFRKRDKTVERDGEKLRKNISNMMSYYHGSIIYQNILHEQIGCIEAGISTKDYGTGFRVGSRYIMTAYHVMANVLESFWKEVCKRLSPAEKQILHICPLDVHPPDGDWSFTNLQDRLTSKTLGLLRHLGKDIIIDNCTIKFSFVENMKVEEIHLSYEIPFASRNHDVVILTLCEPNEMSAPLSLQQRQVHSEQLHVIGHPEGRMLHYDSGCLAIEKENELSELIERAVTFFQNPNFKLGARYVKKAYEQLSIKSGEILFHCSTATTHGASGSPLIAIIKNKPIVTGILQHGYPKFFYNQLRHNQDAAQFPEYLIESGITMEKIHDLLCEHGQDNLLNDIFA